MCNMYISVLIYVDFYLAGGLHLERREWMYFCGLGAECQGGFNTGPTLPLYFQLV